MLAATARGSRRRAAGRPAACRGSTREVAGDRAKRSDRKRQAQLGIGLPDPVGAGVGDIAKARLAGLDRLGRLAGVAQDDAGEGDDHAIAIASAGVTDAQELPAGLVRLPGQRAERRCRRGPAAAASTRCRRPRPRRPRAGGPPEGSDAATASRKRLVDPLGIDQDRAGARRQLEVGALLRRDRAQPTRSTSPADERNRPKAGSGLSSGAERASAISSWRPWRSMSNASAAMRLSSADA